MAKPAINHITSGDVEAFLENRSLAEYAKLATRNA